MEISRGIGRGHVGQLLQRGAHAVVVDEDAVEQGGRSAARAHGVELRPQRLDGAIHAPIAVFDQLVDHARLPSGLLKSDASPSGRDGQA